MAFSKWLKLPETKEIKSIDDVSTTELHGSIILKKQFLKKIYLENYQQFIKSIGTDYLSKKVVELGSGGGFIKDIIPNAITSDVIELPQVEMYFSALDMPFENNSVDAFVMIDVLHHINDSEAFFVEALRCLKQGGKIVMIEPANTLWGGFIYRNFHHEPFDAKGGWGFESKGPMSSANGAIPWILFVRDRQLFIEKFPQLKINILKHHTPFRYLISGGVSMRQLLPSFCYPLVKGFEFILSPLNRGLGMFMTVELEKI
jgi:SAM-dependent methyltransferase